MLHLYSQPQEVVLLYVDFDYIMTAQKQRLMVEKQNRTLTICQVGNTSTLEIMHTSFKFQLSYYSQPTT